MKVNRLLFYVLCGALCLSCSDDKEEQGGSASAGNAITFGIEVSDYTVATRVTQDGSSWNAGDRIGAFALDASTSEVVEGKNNALYTCLTSGESVTFTSENPIALQEDGTTVEFVAYYPYNADVQGIYYPVQLAEQGEGSAACDLMYGISDAYTYSAGSNTQIALSFSHRLSKVRMRMVNMQGVSLDVTDVAIEGMYSGATFNVQTAALTPTESEDITPYLNTETGYYEALVLPSSLSDDYKLSFRLNGTELEWSFTDIEDIDLPYFNRGYQYTFAVYINDKGMVEVGRLESIEDGNTSSPWSGGSNVTGVASRLTYSLFPENGASSALADTELNITFEKTAPALGTSGYIRIYDAETGEEVDAINMEDEHTPFATTSSDTEARTLHTWMNIIGAQSTKSGSRNRKIVINYYPVEVEENTLVIKPHCGRLEAGKTYYVTVDKEAVSQSDFQGVSAGEWTFTTKSLPSSAEVTVSHTDATADFYTLQGAIDYLATHVDNATQKTVTLDAGTYKEVINLRDQDNITVKSKSGNAEDVVLKYRNYNNLNSGTNDGMDIAFDAPLGTVVTGGCNRSVLIVAGSADKIRFEQMTIQNAYGWDDSVSGTVTYHEGQAEAVLIRNSGAVAFVGCRLLGNQDTLIAGNGSSRGFSYFSGCYIAGGTDFIWSCGTVALFDQCEIEAISNTRAVMQARVPSGVLGYVFKECEFTAPEGSTSAKLIYSTDSNDDNLTFLSCSFASTYITHFVGEGTLHPATPTATTGCKMYSCTLADGTTDAYTSLSDTWKSSVYSLSQDEYTSNYGSVSAIMSSYTTPTWFEQE